jgi:hypothetical protein
VPRQKGTRAQETHDAGTPTDDRRNAGEKAIGVMNYLDTVTSWLAFSYFFSVS